MVEFKDLKLGDQYMHTEHGECILIAPHPHDGAHLVMEGYNEEEDEHFFFGCERTSLSII